MTYTITNNSIAECRLLSGLLLTVVFSSASYDRPVCFGHFFLLFVVSAVLFFLSSFSANDTLWRVQVPISRNIDLLIFLLLRRTRISQFELRQKKKRQTQVSYSCICACVTEWNRNDRQNLLLNCHFCPVSTLIVGNLCDRETEREKETTAMALQRFEFWSRWFFRWSEVAKQRWESKMSQFSIVS